MGDWGYNINFLTHQFVIKLFIYNPLLLINAGSHACPLLHVIIGCSRCLPQAQELTRELRDVMVEKQEELKELEQQINDALCDLDGQLTGVLQPPGSK